MSDATGGNALSAAAAKRAARAAAQRRRRQNPEVRAAEAAAKRRRREDPAVRAAQAEDHRRRRENQRVRDAEAQARRRRREDPSVRAAEAEDHRRRRREDPRVRGAEAQARRRRREDPAVRAAEAQAKRSVGATKTSGAKTFPRTSGSSVHHSSGSLGSNAGEGGGEEAAYSCKKCKSAAAVHRADTECQVYVLPTSFNRSTQLCARLGVKSVQCDFVADCCVRRRTSAMTQTETKGSVSCMVQEPIPVAPLDPRCIACGLERSHNTVLHPLPVREPDRHKWIDFIRQCPGRGDSLHWTPPEHVQSFVCSLHFESSSFTRIFPEKRLRPSAIPTLYPKRALITTMGAVTAPEDGTGTHVTDVQWSHHALHAI
ncbi:uncharacterized protein LOC144106209 isoform X1 [Amblyomma americanum]